MAITDTSKLSLPIESYIGSIFEQVASDAVYDLRQVGTQVQNNMAEKEAIRKAMAALATMKKNFLGDTDGSFVDSANVRGQVRAALEQAGVPADAKVMQELNSFQPGASKEAMEAWFKSMETALDGESQARSDFGQQLQLKLQEANNIYTRVSKAQSDTSAKYSQMLDGIAQNLK